MTLSDSIISIVFSAYCCLVSIWSVIYIYIYIYIYSHKYIYIYVCMYLIYKYINIYVLIITLSDSIISLVFSASCCLFSI